VKCVPPKIVILPFNSIFFFPTLILPFHAPIPTLFSNRRNRQSRRCHHRCRRHCSRSRNCRRSRHHCRCHHHRVTVCTALLELLLLLLCQRRSSAAYSSFIHTGNGFEKAICLFFDQHRIGTRTSRQNAA